MSPVWRVLVGASCAFAACSIDVSGFERLVAVAAFVTLLITAPGRRALWIAGVALGVVGATRVHTQIARAEPWSDVDTWCLVHFDTPRDAETWNVQLAHPDVGTVAARLRRAPAAARAGDVWRLHVTTAPLPRTRNPDDRRALRSALASGAVIRARVVDEGVRLRPGRGPGLAGRLVAGAETRWHERLGSSAGLWSALLLADRAGLSRDATQDVQRVGFAHLLALSGLHVGVVVGLLAVGLARVGRAGPLLAVPVLIAWTVLAGAGPSMTRAVAMVALVVVGRHERRHVRLEDVLAFCACAELAVRPAVLGGIGWWLSYAATLAILRAVPTLRGRPWWVQGLGVSLIAQLGTLPWIIDAFGRLPLLAPVVLLAVGPLFSLVLAVGGLAAVLALAGVPGTAAIAALGAHAFGLSLHLARGTGDVAWSHPGLDDHAWAVTCVIWAWWFVPHARVAWRSGTAMTVALLAVLHATVLGGPGHTWISFDIGQGDGGLYRCGARTLVVDTGPGSGDWRPIERSILPYLERRGIDGVDVVLTHRHADHVAGTRRLLTTGRVRTLMMAASDRPDRWAQGYAALADSVGASVRWLRRGDVLWDACCRPRVLWPPDDPVQVEALHDPNDRSVVLALGPPHARLLATGDLERVGERAVRAGLEDTDTQWILKVAHHGGDTGTDADFLATLRPSWGLISCGHDNRYGHPREVVLQRLRDAGTQVVRTDRCGAITVRWTRHGFAVETAGGGP